jgi:hypothetical protein
MYNLYVYVNVIYVQIHAHVEACAIYRCIPRKNLVYIRILAALHVYIGICVRVVLLPGPPVHLSLSLSLSLCIYIYIYISDPCLYLSAASAV